MAIHRTYTRSELRWMDGLLLVLVGAGLLVIVRGYQPLAGFGLVLLGLAGNLRLRQVLRDGGTESIAVPAAEKGVPARAPGARDAPASGPHLATVTASSRGGFARAGERDAPD